MRNAHVNARVALNLAWWASPTAIARLVYVRNMGHALAPIGNAFEEVVAVSQLSTGNGKRKTATSADDGIDYVDPVRAVAERWRWSYDSIMREVARGNLKLTILGPRRKGIRRSEQRRYLDAHTS